MLAPAASSSEITSFGWWPFSRRHRNYVGIAIGVDHLEIAAFGPRSERSSKSLHASSLAWTESWGFDLPIGESDSPPPNWVGLIAETITDRLPRCMDGDRNHCVISLPLPWVHYQISDVSELESTQQQCDTMFSESLFQCAAQIRHWPVVVGSDARMVAASANDASSRIAEAVSAVGYQVEAVLPHGVALLHAATELTAVQPAAVIMLEFSGGLVSVAEKSACGLTRHLPACRLTADRRPFVDELEPWMQQIASEVNATIRYAERLGGTVERDSPLLLSGRAATIPGIGSLLATLVGRPVATWRYAGRSRPSFSTSSEHCPEFHKRKNREQTIGGQVEKRFSDGDMFPREDDGYGLDPSAALALSLAFAAVDLKRSWSVGSSSK